MDGLIDLHMHTFFSDGVLLPSELVQRARSVNYKAMALTDHADNSNIESLLTKYNKFVKAIKDSTDNDIIVLPGVELTHVAPSLIDSCTKFCRKFGAKIVACHGQTVVEPVPQGTNKAAILAGVDFLAHPGLITEADVKLAAEKGVYLELTLRKGHSLTNGHVAKLAKKFGAKLIVNTDFHSPDDLMSIEKRRNVVIGAGLDESDLKKIMSNSEQLLAKLT
ncbi:histidinol phosphate phosphatase domain-containing protein [bacterium]|nr:histidinol phosphate phosphatase domain-containing protein [bacterium]